MKRRLTPFFAFLLAAVLTHLAGRALLASRLDVSWDSSASAATGARSSRQPVETAADEITGGDNRTSRASKAPRSTTIAKGHEAFMQRVAEVKKSLGSDLALDDQGRLTPVIIDLAGLSPIQVEEAQQIIDSAWDRMAKNLRSRMTIEPVTDDPVYSIPAKYPLQVKKFHITADPSTGVQVMDDLRRDLTSAIGTDGMEAIIAMLSTEAYFGGMGQYEIEGKLVSGSDPERPFLKVHWGFVYPPTGQALRSFSPYDGAVRKYNGHLFDEWAP
ncbi:MAG: hypothetical protein JWO82_564 [Akkermansiaceae bacterium]|nr:hypothetical protein [Akkermansiaceae bacterium]